VTEIQRENVSLRAELAEVRATQAAQAALLQTHMQNYAAQAAQLQTLQNFMERMAARESTPSTSNAQPPNDTADEAN
jgi:hypothetical protein